MNNLLDNYNKLSNELSEVQKEMLDFFINKYIFYKGYTYIVKDIDFKSNSFLCCSVSVNEYYDIVFGDYFMDVCFEDFKEANLIYEEQVVLINKL